MCVCVYLFELAHGECEQVDKLLLVLHDAHSGDLRQTFQRHVAKHGDVQELKGGRQTSRVVLPRLPPGGGTSEKTAFPLRFCRSVNWKKPIDFRAHNYILKIPHWDHGDEEKP